MYVASTTRNRLHAYPATVDTALTMIHLDVYVRIANVIIISIIDNTYNFARLTRLGRCPYDIIISGFFTIRDIKLHYWQQDIK